ncbi:15910_t:CDS:2, partial [Rhizophagus irregularis]
GGRILFVGECKRHNEPSISGQYNSWICWDPKEKNKYNRRVVKSYTACKYPIEHDSGCDTTSHDSDNEDVDEDVGRCGRRL